MAELLYATSHIAGTFTNPTNAVGSTTATWAGQVNVNVNETSRWALGDPVNPLTSAATHTVNVLARKGSNSGTPTITINLWENGALVSAGSPQNVTSTTGQTISRTFTTAQVTNRANVEIEIVATSVAGSISVRNSAQIDYIEWSADTTAPVSFMQVAQVHLRAPHPPAHMHVAMVDLLAPPAWWRTWRIDYADESTWTSDQGPPTITTGVLDVVRWQAPPRRTLEYGNDTYNLEGTILTGEEIDAEVWETHRLSLYTEPHPFE